MGGPIIRKIMFSAIVFDLFPPKNQEILGIPMKCIFSGNQRNTSDVLNVYIIAVVIVRSEFVYGDAHAGGVGAVARHRGGLALSTGVRSNVETRTGPSWRDVLTRRSREKEGM